MQSTVLTKNRIINMLSTEIRKLKNESELMSLYLEQEADVSRRLLIENNSLIDEINDLKEYIDSQPIECIVSRIVPKGSNCGICYESNDVTYCGKCGNPTCEKCFSKLIGIKKCPFCRAFW